MCLCSPCSNQTLFIKSLCESSAEVQSEIPYGGAEVPNEAIYKGKERKCHILKWKFNDPYLSHSGLCAGQRRGLRRRAGDVVLGVAIHNTGDGAGGDGPCGQPLATRCPAQPHTPAGTRCRRWPASDELSPCQSWLASFVRFRWEGMAGGGGPSGRGFLSPGAGRSTEQPGVQS